MSNLIITPYTEKSFVVLGNTLDHADALTQLGGSYNSNLRIGPGWIFAKIREKSVKYYIETGEIKKYEYSNEEKEKYRTSPNTVNTNKVELKKLFGELRNAFKEDCDYEGKDIVELIIKFEQKYIYDKEITRVPKLKNIETIEPEKASVKLTKQSTPPQHSPELEEEKATVRLSKKK